MTIIQARLGARVALLLAVVCVVALPVWRAQQARLSLAQVAGSDRQALLARTMENVRVACASQGDAALEEQCHQQAELLLQLDECDSACRELAVRYADRPTS